MRSVRSDSWALGACCQEAFSPRKDTTFMSSSISSRMDRCETSFLARISSLYLSNSKSTDIHNTTSRRDDQWGHHLERWLVTCSCTEHLAKLCCLDLESCPGVHPELLGPYLYLRVETACKRIDLLSQFCILRCASSLQTWFPSFPSHRSCDNQAKLLRPAACQAPARAFQSPYSHVNSPSRNMLKLPIKRY